MVEIADASGLLAAASAPRQGFTSVNAFTALLTTESLLFTAFNVALSLATPIEGGRPRLLVRPRILAFWAFVLLLVVGCGAVLAWIDVFASDLPSNLLKLLPIIILLVGCVAQPIFALVIARGMPTQNRVLEP